MKHHVAIAGFFCLSVILGSALRAQPELGVRALALSGSYRAYPLDNDGFYYNPAGITEIKRFGIEADYLYRFVPGQHEAALSLVDSSTSNLAVGLGYNIGIDTKGTGLALSHLGSLVFAYPIWQDVMSLGVTGKYMNRPAISTDAAVSRFSMDAGILVMLPFGVSLAAVGYNLVPTNTPRFQTEVGFGTALNVGSLIAASPINSENRDFTVAVDYVIKNLTDKDALNHVVSAGVEGVIADAVPLRGGYAFDITKRHHSVSVGAGVQTQVAAINAVFVQNISDFNNRIVGGNLSLTF